MLTTDRYQNLYAVLYINTDEPKLSETLGIFDEKDKAIAHLIERAGYREKNGQLTQYMHKTTDYESMEQIVDLVKKTGELIDYDIYRIEDFICETTFSQTLNTCKCSNNSTDSQTSKADQDYEDERCLYKIDRTISV